MLSSLLSSPLHCPDLQYTVRSQSVVALRKEGGGRVVGLGGRGYGYHSCKVPSSVPSTKENQKLKAANGKDV